MQIRVANLCNEFLESKGGEILLPRTLAERGVEAIQDAVELHAHLIGQRPARVVVRRDRRAAWILKIVRVVLRFEHVHDMGPECLSRQDDK